MDKIWMLCVPDNGRIKVDGYATSKEGAFFWLCEHIYEAYGAERSQKMLSRINEDNDCFLFEEYSYFIEVVSCTESLPNDTEEVWIVCSMLEEDEIADFYGIEGFLKVATSLNDAYYYICKELRRCYAMYNEEEKAEEIIRNLVVKEDYIRGYGIMAKPVKDKTPPYYWNRWNEVK